MTKYCGIITWFAIFLAADKVGAQVEQTEQNLRGIRFVLPANWTIEKVADQPLIRWPVVADWDKQGRLVVVESGGVGWPIQEHNKQLLHRVVRLIDQDGDGSFDERIVAADQLPFAEGVLCLDDDLLVAAPPNIWKLTDRDGDGICEEREVWFDGQTVTNCANDLHGPYLGRDGWIYWCKGAFGEQVHELADGKVLRDKAAHIFRRRLEGGAIEPVISGGMDNPVEMAFTPEGEKFFTSTFLQHPGDGKRDGIGHAVYGAVFGKDHAVLDGLVRTGDLMPIMTHLGPAAPSGLICLEKNDLIDWPDANSEVRTLVAAQFNMHKVSAHYLIAQEDSTYGTVNQDLLVADRVDFHPTDVLEGAAGDLWVIDTGGWYDLCCPTSRVDQKVAAGGIYRLSRTPRGAVPIERREFSWDTLAAKDCVPLLSDSRPWIRRQAQLRVRRLNHQAVPELIRVLNSNVSRNTRLDALWGLSLVGTENALAAAVEVLDGDEDRLRQAACHILGLHRFAPARLPLERLLSVRSRVLQRAAAEALGRIGKVESIEAIMNCLAIDQAEERSWPLPVLEHSLIHAMIEIGARESLVEYLDNSSPAQTRAALVALNQLQDQQFLTARVVLDALRSEDHRLRDTAIQVLGTRPAWSAEAKDVLGELWSQRDRRDVFDTLLALVRTWREQLPIQELAAQWIFEGRVNATPAIAGLVACWRGTNLPQAFAWPLAEWCGDSPAVVADILEGVHLESELCRPLVQAIQTQLEESGDLPTAIRLVSYLPAGEMLRRQDLFDQLVAEGNYALISKLRLSESQAEQLIPQLTDANPLELPDLIAAIASAGRDGLDRTVLGQLATMPVARTLGSNVLPNAYRGRAEDLRRLAEQTNAVLQAPTGDIQAATQSLLRQLPAGDPVRGLQVFRSAKAACSACHQVGYVGGRIGPELTRIGKTRTRESLLESILFPSARIEQSFRPMKVLTTDGQVVNGLMIAAAEGGIRLQTGAEKIVQLPRADIEFQEPSEVSIMPSGIQELLSEQELADLLAFLEAAK